MAEDLSDYLLESGLRVRYLHSNIDTIERIEILRDLRLGEFDVLVGINLLREGLDLPEVSLVAILDADKEGFLRSATSLIQTMGRAARNVAGRVILYADVITDSMRGRIAETERRRDRAAGLQRRARHRPADDPQGGHRPRRAVPQRRRRGGDGFGGGAPLAEPGRLGPLAPGRPASRGARGGTARVSRAVSRHGELPAEELARLIETLEAEMTRPRPSCASSTRRGCATRSGRSGASCERSADVRLADMLGLGVAGADRLAPVGR